MKQVKAVPERFFNRVQFFIGFSALCLGGLIYVTLRSPGRIYATNYFGIHDRIFEVSSPILHTLANSMPAFLHVFSFILISASFVTYSKKTYAAIAVGWLVVDCCFELGQKYKSLATRLHFDFFESIPFLETTRNFFLLGTFDIGDIIAFVLGTVFAFWTLVATSRFAR